ncbi:MFS transporter [Sphingomonas nostoxanthinifaciens]|uniref:MFS transporter n=1 Tax=Sphingomonas nostoxanthinifaciens TaxID=2872652 RepID=UPI001CC21B9A|nr:MFS transporter [Sphingomonas nostoxanthinifaciens]UAK25064.1 MFS transporter [Sphingomonas nostoxanthinifaciens]
MDTRRLVGLGGILLAAMVAQLNDQVTATALADVSGGLGISHDDGTWLRTLYVTGEVIGMCMAPSLGVAFSIRHFALFAIGLSCAATLPIPLFGADPAILLSLRALQGLAAGFTIPLLMTTALRVLDPPIRLYGLAVYALTATFTPNLATTLAALWTDVVDDWRFVFFEALPFCAVAAVMVWWGMMQDPPNYDRLRHFDWPGALLVAAGFGSLSIVLEQGDRLDWYNSSVIAVMTLVAILGIAGFLIRETRAEQPLIRLDLLKRRNFAYAALTLIFFLVIALSASQVPLTFLEQVKGYKPLQAHWLTLEVAATQLVLLPATALLLDIEWVDSRWVSAVGFACILTACIMGLFLTPAWTRDQFFLQQMLQSVGFSFVVMPLLMMATNVVDPKEGPYASALVNGPRAVAEAIGAWLIELIGRWRGGLHRTRIVETIGADRLNLIQAAPIPGAVRPALTPQGVPSAPGALEALNSGVDAAVTTLTTIDTFLVLGCLVIFLMAVLAVLPERTYPPRIQLAKH